MSDGSKALLFSYGTLRHRTVQVGLFGRALRGWADEIVGFELAAYRVDDPEFIAKSGTTVHTIVRFTGRAESRVAGIVFEVTDEELARSDQYEPAGYTRVIAKLASGRDAWVYAAAGGRRV